MNIVVLDDSPTVLLTLQSMLEDLGVPANEIHLFESGFNALEYIKTNGADLIFSDIQMPEFDGYAFVERLLELSGKYASALFVVSGEENFEAYTKMKSIGGKRFIRKPINPRYFNHFVSADLAKIQNRIIHRSAQESRHPDLQPSSLPVHANERWENLASSIGLPTKYMPRLVTTFIKETKNTIPLLETAIEERNFPAIRHYAHAMKGSTGNMKLGSLYSLFGALEHAAGEEDCEYTFGIAFDTVEKKLESVIIEFETLLS